MQARLAVVITVLALGGCVVALRTASAQPGSGDASSGVAGSASGGTIAAEAGDVPEIPSKNLWQIIRAGGILMAPIIFCSFLTLVFCFERGIALRRSHVVPAPFVKRFLHQLAAGQLDREQAIRICDQNDSPVAHVFRAAARKWGRTSVEVEQAILDEGERAVNGLRRYVRVFNGVATVSPLLGLLGTVFGMIKAFNDIAGSEAMGRPELLAAGISEALITTAAGLLVAIPALCLYLFYVSRVDRLVVEIDALGQEVVRLIASDVLPDSASVRGPRPSKKEAA